MNFTSQPVVFPNPNPRAPLASVVECATESPSRVTLDVFSDDRSWRLDSGSEPRERHRIPLIGLRPGTTGRVEVAAEDVRGGKAAASLICEAPRLPSDLPPMDLVACVPEKREPGAMVFNVRYAPASESRPGMGLLAAVDRIGEIVWIYRIGEAIGDVRRLANGNALYVADGRICEIDFLGDTRREWYAAGRWKGRTPPEGSIRVDTGMFHHAAIELPSGNILACSMEIREIGGFPATEDDPNGGTETAKVVGDVLVEFRREDGEIVNRYPLLDLLDPRRVCYGSRAAYWIRRGYPDTCDWSHANGLAYDDADDSFVVSLRHQDCLVKIDRASGSLVWILGTHANWRKPWADKLLVPEPGLEWQYHQHDCSITPSGAVMCFDNGNHRATPFDRKTPEAESYSRVVEFAVENGRVRQAWARGRREDGAFSCFQSGAYRLPGTGNTFIDYGGVCTIDGIPSADVNAGHCRTRLVEVAPDGEIVFELVVNDESAQDPAALSSFRAEHFPALGTQCLLR